MSKLFVRQRIKGSDRPIIQQINGYGIRDGVATEWHDLGVHLLPNNCQVQLSIIKSNNRTDVKACSTEMFQYWLQVDITASWNKLIEALRKIKKYDLAQDISENVLQEKSSREAIEIREETEVNNQRRSMTKTMDTHDPPSLTVVVGKRQNKNGTNGSHQAKKDDSSTIWHKPSIITLTIVILAVAGGIMAILYTPVGIQGLQQQQQDTTSSTPKSTHQNEDTINEPKLTSRGKPKEYKVFQKYRGKLTKLLPTENILTELISAEIIKENDRERIDGKSTLQEKASYVLSLVHKSLEADYTKSFYSLLDIMEEYGGDVTDLANDIKKDLDK